MRFSKTLSARSVRPQRGQPRGLRSAKTLQREFAPSVCSIQIPRMSRSPSGSTAKARDTALPGGHFRHDLVVTAADQIGRKPRRTHFLEKGLNLAHR
jgi:hypothetical protein